VSYPIKDMTGQRFGRLVAIKLFGIRALGGAKSAVWECQCDCGTVVNVVGHYLRNGGTRSCGCLRRDLSSQRYSTHGMTGTPEHRTWASMRARCYSPICNGYKNYGGRGIKVCERWFSFENFYIDVGPRPSSKHTIDRVDANGDYEPSNVVWSTMSEQNRNRRNNRRLLAFGEERLVVEWLEIYPINRDTLTTRIEAALSIPALAAGKRHMPRAVAQTRKAS